MEKKDPSSYVTSPKCNLNSGGSTRTRSSHCPTRHSSAMSGRSLRGGRRVTPGFGPRCSRKNKTPFAKLVVVEATETGAGASGRNGGFCSASLTHGFNNGMARFSDEMALIERLGRDNLNEIEATIER